MIVALASGRNLSMSLEEYLSLSDEDFQGFQAYEQGYYINNPLCDSALVDLIDQPVESIEEDEYNDQSLFTEEDIWALMETDYEA